MVKTIFFAQSVEELDQFVDLITEYTHSLEFDEVIKLLDHFGWDYKYNDHYNCYNRNHVLLFSNNVASNFECELSKIKSIFLK